VQLLYLTPYSNGTAAPPFVPTDIPGLLAWFDGADATSMTIGSSFLISQWNDKSGNGNNATNSNTATQPTYSANQLNGKSTVAFPGGMNLAFGSAQMINPSSPFTITFVVEFSVVNNPFSIFFALTDANGVTDQPYFNINKSGTTTNVFIAGPVSTYAANIGTNLWNPSIGTDTYYAITFTYNGMGLSNQANFGFSVNGTSYVLNSGDNDDTNGGANIIGNYAPGGAFGASFTGFFADIYVYNTQFTGPQSTAFYGYLSSKWGIAA
jgi:hypothetical protein